MRAFRGTVPGVINVCDETLHRYLNEMIAKQDLLNGIHFFVVGSKGSDPLEV